MSEHRDRWLAYGRKVDDLTRTPMRVRDAEEGEQPDWLADGKWGHEQADHAWHWGFEAGYHAALADVKAAWTVGQREPAGDGT